jgi:cyanophycin synthetase
MELWYKFSAHVSIDFLKIWYSMPMYELSYGDLPDLKISTRMIAKELLDRGYPVHGFLSSKGLLEVTLPDSPVVMRIYSVIDESMSFISGRIIAGNKQVTNAIVARLGIAVPDELYVGLTETEEKKQEIVDFIKSHGTVVVKPVDGAHGRGVFTGVTEYEQVADAVQTITGLTIAGGFIIQQQLQGLDIRVICVDGKYASAMTRVPATVTGDGEHTVEQLIQLENQRAERSGENYSTIFNKIDMSYVERHLTPEKLIAVPAEGEAVQVIGISNVGVGGTRKNLDEDIPQFIREASEKIAGELRLPVCGIDFFVDAIPQATDTKEDLNPVVIEVNNCPGLTQYESFDDPRQIELVKKLVDAQVAAHYRLYPTRS